MTRTQRDAYDRGFAAAMELRVQEYQEVLAELALRRRMMQGSNLRLSAALLLAGLFACVAVLR